MSVNSHTKTGLAEILSKHEAKLVSDWVKEQSADPESPGRAAEGVRASQGMRGVYRTASEEPWKMRVARTSSRQAWSDVREMLEHLSRARTVQGCSPSETASFIFSLKRPLFTHLRRELERRRPGPGRRDLVDQRAARQPRPLHDRSVPEGPRRDHQPPARGDARAFDAGREALGRDPGLADDRHARQRPHPDRHGKPVAEDRRDRARPSRSSISRAFRRSTR